MCLCKLNAHLLVSSAFISADIGLALLGAMIASQLDAGHKHSRLPTQSVCTYFNRHRQHRHAFTCLTHADRLKAIPIPKATGCPFFGDLALFIRLKRPSACSFSPFTCHATAAGSVLWRKDFGAEHALTSIKVDPTDWRHMCLCGAKGSIIVLRLVNLGRDKVEQQTYKVDMSSSKPGDTLRCCFSATRDLLYVLLPREVSAYSPQHPALLYFLGCTQMP